jgi:transcriptional regulator with XRE-family HTH domain
MDVRKRVGLNLQRLREAKGLTQEELAHQADVHQTYLSGVEGGKRNPSIAVLNRIATALAATSACCLVPGARSDRQADGRSDSRSGVRSIDTTLGNHHGLVRVGRKNLTATEDR